MFWGFKGSLQLLPGSVTTETKLIVKWILRLIKSIFIDIWQYGWEKSLKIEIYPAAVQG